MSSSRRLLPTMVKLAAFLLVVGGGIGVLFSGPSPSPRNDAMSERSAGPSGSSEAPAVSWSPSDPTGPGERAVEAAPAGTEVASPATLPGSFAADTPREDEAASSFIDRRPLAKPMPAASPGLSDQPAAELRLANDTTVPPPADQINPGPGAVADPVDAVASNSPLETVPQVDAPAARSEPTVAPPARTTVDEAAGERSATPASPPLLAPPAFSDDRLLRPLPAALQPKYKDDRTIAAPQRPAGPGARALFRDQRSLHRDAPSAQSASPNPAPSVRSGIFAALLPPAAPPEPAQVGCAEPRLATKALPAGQMQLAISAPCFPGQSVQIRYGGIELVRRLDGQGAHAMLVDCFAGRTTPLVVRFASGLSLSTPVVALDLEHVSKIAVTWRAPVDLDLHVFEYGARTGGPGHLWSQVAASAELANAVRLRTGRGAGFIGTASKAGESGDKLEVYTFFHDARQGDGTINLALDYASRGALPSGAACGDGALAEVAYELVLLPRGGSLVRKPGRLARAACGKPLTLEARLTQSALPSLRIRK